MPGTHEVAHHDRAVLLFESGDVDPWFREEMRELARTAEVEVLAEFHARSHRRPGQPFLSAERGEELYQQVVELGANTVLVAADLSPGEHSELQEMVEVRVVDRSQLILDIFARRAHTREGKLQVELALLNYLLPRLTGAGTEMSRLGGGVGTRGPGETKLESDRRRLRRRIGVLAAEIDAVQKHREVARSGRKSLPFPSAALVGYTSAGKSTLLNVLSGADVAVDARLFSTLDPTTRRVVLPDGWGILITDTVGFIRDLPHTLIAAFRATLEEVREADVLVHVVDASHPARDAQIEAVRRTLEEIGAGGKPTVTVYNKSDLCSDTYELRRLVASEPLSCYISALKGEGLSHLMDRLAAAVRGLLTRVQAVIPYSRSELLSAAYDNGRVVQADYREDGIHLVADVTASFAGLLAPFRRDGRAGED
jgi:GTP-binding protein HflX